MTGAMKSFTPVESTLSDMEAFYARVADSCRVNARRTHDSHSAAFLLHVAEQADQLVELLARDRHERSERHDAALAVWMQATPDSPLPGEAELWQLQGHGSDPSRTLAWLHEVSGRWADHHRQLAELSRTEAGRELHGSIQQLLTGWCKRLNTSYLALHDL